VQLFRFDLDSFPDLILLVILTALGVGILVEVVDEEVIPLYLAIGVVATGFVIDLFTVATPLNSTVSTESLDALFWEQQVTERCHVRMSATEERFVELVEEGVNVEECRYQVRQIVRNWSSHITANRQTRPASANASSTTPGVGSLR